MAHKLVMKLSQKAKLMPFIVIAICAVLAFLVIGVRAEEFIKGYKADTTLLRGTVVSRTDDPNKVEQSSRDNSKNLLGVVVRSNDSALLLSSEENQVYVATSGTYEVFVSNVNGEIKNGDFIAPSSIKGVASNAREEEINILGKAVQDLDLTKTDNILSTTTVSTTNGETREVAIGKILVEVDIGDNPRAHGVLGYVPEVVKRVGESVAGKQVAPSRIYASLGVLIISFGLGGSMLYASVRSSIIAIGRNPLARKSVLRSMSKVIITSLAIFFTGFVAVYLILTI
ncbi:hypothetical protein DYH10_03130 [Candidatus Saccharibacteria bacterium CPR2]|nr:hypothetical protein [Candidatus Saccharibacteria bacterium CPR2]